MIFIVDPYQNYIIEKYCSQLDEIVVRPIELNDSFIICPQCTSKKDFQKAQNNLEQKILSHISKIHDINALSIALFIYRTVLKNKMYSEGFDGWTERFIVCNYLFFLSLKCKKKTSLKIFLPKNSEKDILEYLFHAGYTFFFNRNSFSQQYYDEQSVSLYRERLDFISTLHNDLNSYEIINNDLKNYLNNKNMNATQLKKNIPNPIESISWKVMLSHNMFKKNDSIIKIPIDKINLLTPELQKFIHSFEASKCKNPSDNETELIFSFKTKYHYYISKKLLHDTRNAINSFATWGQYENIFEYFFETHLDTKIKNNYNKFLTYKIADLLLTNNYILPTNLEKDLVIPRIEISNYSKDKKLAKKLGDLDLIFYSKKSKILYIIEFKNYQMLVSRMDDLSTEYSKVKSKDTPHRINKRHKYACEHVEDFKILFREKSFEISKITSILLTTKPCFYFYTKESMENKCFDYMDWIEFKEKVEKNYF